MVVSHGCELFLKSFHHIVTKERGLDIIPRATNNETIKKLGLTKQNVKDIILGLSVANYTCKKISDISHQEEGYIKTSDRNFISYEYTKTLNIAKLIIR